MDRSDLEFLAYSIGRSIAGFGELPTLRDRFAVAALAGATVEEWNDTVNLAKWAYKIADAMLQAREEGEKK